MALLGVTAPSLLAGEAGDDVLSETLRFPAPCIVERDGGLQVQMDGASYVRLPGEPVIPYYRKVVVLPYKTRAEVSCAVRDISSMPLEGELVPARPFFTNGAPADTESVSWGEHTWYTSRLTAGLHEGCRVNFLVINFYPVRFGHDTLTYAQAFDLTVRLTRCAHEEANVYDHVIICPALYRFPLNVLAAHRTDQGIDTVVVTLADIYGGAHFEAEGRDDAEKIKYFIKNAVDEWGIVSVMLVGGTARLPARTVYASVEEPSFTSDLYYADVLDAAGDFSSWDPNGNEYYGEYNHSGNKEEIDLFPDVYLARLPCRNIFEVFFLVAKYRAYDNLDRDGWFDRFVTVAGDSFDDSPWGTDYVEGEITVAKSIEYMPGFTPVRLWATEGTLSTDNILAEFSAGAGFIHFDGHGNYLSWATHPVHDYNTWIGFGIQDMPAITNWQKPAVVMVGGCHTGEIGMPYECISYRLLRKPGGAIASLGYTSLSWGADDDVNGNGEPDIIEYASGYLNTLFFKQYGTEGFRSVGACWGEAIAEYLLTAPVDWNDEYLDIWDARTVEAWHLFGDPSLTVE
jgi:hypothetical protein